MKDKKRLRYWWKIKDYEKNKKNKIKKDYEKNQKKKKLKKDYEKNQKKKRKKRKRLWKEKVW